MRNQLFYTSIFIVSIAAAYSGVTWMSQSVGTEKSSSEEKQNPSKQSVEGAGTGPVAPQDEHMVQAGSSQPPRIKPFMALPTREQIQQAAHKGDEGNLRMPVMPIPTE